MSAGGSAWESVEDIGARLTAFLKVKTHLHPVICFSILLTVATALFVPQICRVVDRDSGAFLYVGQQLLQGAVPYRDLWDHKGPVVYYLDALGLYISHGSLWGLWMLETLSVTLAAWFGYLALRQVLGVVPAVFGTSMWMISAIRLWLQGGNFVEQWALPLQFGAEYLLITGLARTAGLQVAWRSALVGVLGAIAFLLRPNLIGMWIAVWMCWIVSDWRVALSRTTYLVSAGAALVAATALYFYFNHAFPQMWDAVISYNRAYSSTPGTFRGRLGTLSFGAGLIAAWLVVAGAWAIAVCAAASGAPRPNALRNLLWLGTFLLPVEIVLTAVSGRPYPHYYIAWLPAVATLSGIFAWWIVEYAGAAHEDSADGCALRSSRHRPRIGVSLLTAVAAGAALPALAHWRYQITTGVPPGEDPHYAAAKFVSEVTSAHDTILVWGAESYVYFLSGRKSPTRFFYQYPLATPGYASDALAREFISEVEAHPPHVVIDTGNPKLPRLNAAERYLPPQQRKGWLHEDDGNYVALPPSIEPFFSFLDKNYVRVENIANWEIYVLTAR